ncbi:MAG: hypothetical protein L6R38_002303 [Xanthoria sp. 2 TBL-2021]|nr:MAG: hypothetical protein L6R38_002303 [Xanthoria sp. 2 TBL-2021]
MPPIIPQNSQTPRVVIYHQTHYTRDGQYISLLPLLTEATDVVNVTHLILAAIHLNSPAGNIHLNERPPTDDLFIPLWEEIRILQDVGVKVLGMLGGAAQGSFRALDGTDAEFEEYYVPLRDMLRDRGVDGLDLDVEEEMSLLGVIRLIDRLKADFGEDFLITLAPVATALQGGRHLSGFDYEALEVMRGQQIAWYNVQFYNNWGNLTGFEGYGGIINIGWKAEKVVAGVLTNPANGTQGWVEAEELARTVTMLKVLFPGFGGVMGWEYFNSTPGGEERPWEWAEAVGRAIRGG